MTRSRRSRRWSSRPTSSEPAAPPFPAVRRRAVARLNGIARALGGALHGRPDESALFHHLATHRSDIVRIWACLALRHDPRPTVAERLEGTRPFAADRNMSVREFAIDVFRPLLLADLRPTLDLLLPWVHDPDPNIRRCAIEGSRPRGVWAAHILALKQDPAEALPLLEPVRADPGRYVQNAVANWINDAARTNSDCVVELCRRWQSESPSPATAYIVRRGLRTLRKRGLRL